MTSSCEVLIVGSGPAGLAAAIALRRQGIESVLVVDREQEAGGVPRHCAHTGYGIRDLRRLMTGPQYARHYVRSAEAAGVELRTETFVTGWKAPTCLTTTSPRGIEEIEARAVVLATGCRERPRGATRCPERGRRACLQPGPSSSSFTSTAFRSAAVPSSSAPSMSASLPCSPSPMPRTEIVAMVTDHPVDQTYPLLRLATAGRHRVPVWTGQRVVDVLGPRRVEGVELVDLATGRTRRVECDTLVFSGDWVPDHELARAGGLVIDAGSKGPWIDPGQRTSVKGVFAAGNLLHAAETADVAALCGRHVADRVLSFLRRGEWPESAPIPIEYDPPLSWISPSALRPPAAIPHGEFILRVDQVLQRPLLEARQGARLLWSHRYRRLRPALPIHLPAGWARSVEAEGGPLRFVLGE